MTDTLTQLIWTAGLVAAFVVLLVLPAALIESRIGRDWIRRLRDVEAGRAAQEAEWIESGAWRGPTNEDTQ